MTNPLVLSTHYECDRCGRPNSLRLKMPMDDRTDGVRQEVDLCFMCIIAMASILIKKVPQEERASWLENFKNGVIRG